MKRQGLQQGKLVLLCLFVLMGNVVFGILQIRLFELLDFFSQDTFYFLFYFILYFDLLSSVQMWDKQLWRVNHIVSLDKSQQFIHPKLLYMSGYFIEVVLKSTAMQFRVRLSLDSCVYSIAVGKSLLRRAIGR